MMLLSGVFCASWIVMLKVLLDDVYVSVILSLWNYVGDRFVVVGMFESMICLLVFVECSMVLSDDVELIVLMLMLILLSSILFLLFI